MLINDIQRAWQARQNNATALKARWIVAVEAPTPGDATPDPKAQEPLQELLYISNGNMRSESEERRFDVDGSPKGSMSWQTTNRLEAYSPDEGWVTLLKSDAPKVRPSIEINRPNLRFMHLSGKYILLLWYRGMDSNLSAFEFANWKVCHEKRLSHPSSRYVTLMSGEPGKRISLLFLDRSLGYLPVGSRSGDWPSGDAPLLKFRECTVNVRDDSTPLLCHAKSWLEQYQIPNKPLRTMAACRVEEFEICPPMEDSLFSVDRPEGAPIFDLKPSLSENRETTPASLDNTARSAKQPTQFYYYLTATFVAMLAAAMIWKRTRLA